MAKIVLFAAIARKRPLPLPATDFKVDHNVGRPSDEAALD